MKNHIIILHILDAQQIWEDEEEGYLDELAEMGGYTIIHADDHQRNILDVAMGAHGWQYIDRDEYPQL